MNIPKKYLQIKDYIAGYINMQKIMNSFENNKKTSIIKGMLSENEKYLTITISLITKNKFSCDNIIIHSIYMNKHHNKVEMKMMIKSTLNHQANNFIYEKLFKKLKNEKISDIRIISMDKVLKYNDVASNYLLINLDGELNYIEQINNVLMIINKFNDKAFDYFYTKYISLR